MKVVLAGVGAFGVKHLDAIKQIGGIEVVSVVGGDLAATKEVASKYGVPHATTDLTEALASARRAGRDPLDTDAPACVAGLAVSRSGQARAGGDPARRSLEGCRDGR